MVPQDKRPPTGYMGKSSSECSLVHVPVPQTQQLPMGVYVLCSEVSAGRGWLCLPAALCSRGFRQGLFRSVENRKKSAQKYGSKNTTGERSRV